MVSEQKASLVVVVTRDIVIKHPPPMLGAARLVHQQSGLVVLCGRKMPDAACGAVLLPRRQVDMAIAIERSNEVVTDLT